MSLLDPGDEPQFKVDMVLIRERAMVILEQLGSEMDTSRLGTLSDEAKTDVRARLRQKVNSDPAPLTMMEKGVLLQHLLDELFGFGPLGPLLRNPDLADIYVYGADCVYAERAGMLEKSRTTFENDDHLLQTINRILLPLGKQLNKDSPVVSCKLQNGTWILTALRPESHNAPLLIIRP